MKIIEKTTSRKELCYHCVLVVIDAHTHIEHNARMMQFIYNLDLLNEMSNMFVTKTSLFYVFFNSHLLAIEFTQEDLSVATFAYRLNNLDLIFAYQESKFDAFLL